MIHSSSDPAMEPDDSLLRKKKSAADHQFGRPLYFLNIPGVRFPRDPK